MRCNVTNKLKHSPLFAKNTQYFIGFDDRTAAFWLKMLAIWRLWSKF